MSATLGVIITLVVLFGDGFAATDTTSTTVAPGTTNTTTKATSSSGITLADVINGDYYPNPFNGTWISENEILFKNANGDLVLYNLDTETPAVLVANTSEILRNSSRVSSLSPDKKYVCLSFNEESLFRNSFNARYAVIDLSTGQATYIAPAGVAATNATLQNFVWSPKGSSFAFVYANNVYYQSNLTAPPQQLTTNGKENIIFNGVPDWVYEEEVLISKNAIWFSRDGGKMVYATFDDTGVRIMKIPHYAVSGSEDYPYIRYRDIRYPKSGTRNPTVTVTLRNFASNKDTVFTAPTDIAEPVLKAVKFVGTDRIALLWNDRVQTSLRIDVCSEANDTAAATCSPVFKYTEKNGWIDSILNVRFNTQGDSFIINLPETVGSVRYKQMVQVSEGTTGLWTAKSRTNTSHNVAQILHWTNDDVIWYRANGISDRAEQHIYTVDSSGNVSCFTCNIERTDGGKCLYNNAIFGTGPRVIISCDGPDIPQIFIYNLNGTFLSIWDKKTEFADMISSKNVPVILRMTIPMGAGQSDADAILHVPSDYTSRSNIPLLVYVYGGPETALVKKQWYIDWGASMVSRYGIAVASIDGRGSSLRDIDNLFAVNRRLGTVDIEDQITVTRYLQKNLTWVDSNRTCIWGWSYGGYAASLALARGGDVFKCAIAVSPIVDWRFYDTIYTERYMDTPQNNVAGYANSTLLNDEVMEAFRNKSFLLAHGTEDDNVHHQNSLMLARRLERKDIAFQQVSYTDQNHELGSVTTHLYHKIEKFLLENMFENHN